MKLSQKDRRKASNAVSKVLKQTYFPYIPIDAIFDALRGCGLVVLQEDNTEWAGFLCGSDEHVLFTIAYASSVHIENGLRTYVPIDNAGLFISWYKDDQRKNIEVIGYIS